MDSPFCEGIHLERSQFAMYTAISRKVIGKNVHVTISKGLGLSYGTPLVSRQPSRSAEPKIISRTDSFTIHYK